jgi:hypothetical protein
MSQSNSDIRYTAAQGREFLRGELSDKPNEWVREFAGMIDDPETLDILNHYCSLWRDLEDDDLPRNFLDTRMGRLIIRNASTQAVDRAYRDGNASMLQGMVGLTSSEGDAQDAVGACAKRLTREGAIGLVLGPPGAGKTATTLDVARAWGARTGGRIIGNTSWDGFDAVVTSDLDLLEDMAHHEGPVLAVIDETAQELSGFGQDSKKAESFANDLTFVRKSEGSHGPYAKRGSVLMVNHTRKRTAAAFRRLATFAIEKPSRDDPGRLRLLETEGGKDNFREGDEFKGLTDTRENYAEHEASEFRITIEDDADQDDAPDPDDIARDEAIKTAVRAAKPWSDEGMSARAISNDGEGIVDYSRTWVSDRLREWNEGDHRELIDAPDGATA